LRGGKNPFAFLWKKKETAHAPSEKPAQAAAKQAESANPQSHPAYQPGPKVGRNDSCPCGSGKKYKKCCLGKK